jgi:hypothetical protein
MKRTLLIASLVGTFALGWTVGLRETPTVDAAPRPTCKDNLAKANAENERLTAELAKSQAEFQALLDKERERVRQLEARIGKPATAPSKPVEPKKLQPIQKLD